MKFLKVKNFKTKAVATATLALGAAASAHADLTALQTSITAKVTEAETFGYAILGVGLAAAIGVSLVKKFASLGAK